MRPGLHAKKRQIANLLVCGLPPTRWPQMLSCFLRLEAATARECMCATWLRFFLLRGIMCVLASHRAHDFLQHTCQRCELPTAAERDHVFCLSRCASASIRSTPDNVRSTNGRSRPQRHGRLRRLACGAVELSQAGMIRRIRCARGHCCCSRHAQASAAAGRGALLHPHREDTRTPPSRRGARLCRLGSEHTVSATHSCPLPAVPARAGRILLGARQLCRGLQRQRCAAARRVAARRRLQRAQAHLRALLSLRQPEQAHS